MARPALVIGLGGTGQWVLTFLKHELLDTGVGTMPDGVRLLAFDTINYPNDFIYTPFGNRMPRPNLGTVALENGLEYIHFGSDIRPMVQEIFLREGQRCQSWLKDSIPDFPTYPPNSINVNFGAATLRQIGRLAFIKDIQNGPGSAIKNAIDRGIREIQANRQIRAVNPNDAVKDYSKMLEVIFVGSMAGGTGAGIMLDMALWCRHLLDGQFPGAVTYRAFFVTPQTFTQLGPNQDTEMLVRSFAAWRELNRFQTANAEVGTGTVCYDANNPFMQIKTDQRLFDATYIIDPRRADNPIPNIGYVNGITGNLFQSIAQAIAAILDDSAGVALTEKVMCQTTTLEGHPTAHSAIGTYCFSIPIYKQIQEYSFQLQQMVMTRFLALQQQGEYYVGLQPNQNREVEPLYFGRAAVIADLKRNDYQGKVPNTGFFKLVGVAAESNWVDNAALQEAHARKFTKDGNIGSHCDNGILDKLNLLPDGQAALGLYNTRENHKSMTDWVPQSQMRRGQGFTPCRGRIVIPAECDTVIMDRYESENGSFIQDILQLAVKVQVRLFSNYLRAMVKGYLNGSDPNPTIAKSGKLGWVLQYLKSFEDVLQEYINYCDKVLAKAAGPEIHERLQISITAAKGEYDRNACRTTVFNVFDQQVHPIAYDRERKYIFARMQDAYYRKEVALFRAHKDACEKAKRIVQSASASLMTWKDTLASGWSGNNDHQDTKVGGQYHPTPKENTAIILTPVVVMEEVGKRYYQVTEDEVEKQLSELEWSVEMDGELGEYDDVVEPYGMKFSLKWGGIPLDNRETEDTASNNNRIAFERGREAYKKILLANPDYTVDAELQQLFNKNPDALADALDLMAEPWYMPAPGGQGPFYKDPREAIFAVSSGNVAAQQGVNALPYYQQVVNQLIAIDRKGTIYSLKNREDKFKLTLVRFDNIIKSEDFLAYQECKEAYISMQLNPGPNTPQTHKNLEFFHIYPEEVNASKYERKIKDTLNLNFSPLGAKTVLLLADDQKIELFFRSVAYGIVRVAPGLNNDGVPGLAWVCQADENSPVIQMTDVVNGFGAAFSTYYPRLITQFAYKGRDFRKAEDNRIDYSSIAMEINRRDMEDRTKAVYKAMYDIPGSIEERQKLLDTVMKQYDGDMGTFSQGGQAKLPKRVFPILADLAVKQNTDLCRLGETIMRIAANNPVDPKNGKAIL